MSNVDDYIGEARSHLRQLKWISIIIFPLASAFLIVSAIMDFLDPSILAKAILVMSCVLMAIFSLIIAINFICLKVFLRQKRNQMDSDDEDEFEDDDE